MLKLHISYKSQLYNYFEERISSFVMLIYYLQFCCLTSRLLKVDSFVAFPPI